MIVSPVRLLGGNSLANSPRLVSVLLLPSPLAPTLHILIDSNLISSTEPAAIHASSSSTTTFLTGAHIQAYLESLQSKEVNEAEGTVAQIRVVDFAAIKADQVADKPAGQGAGKEAREQAEKKKKEGRKEDAYELAIAYTKEGDFPGWYSDVSCAG